MKKRALALALLLLCGMLLPPAALAEVPSHPFEIVDTLVTLYPLKKSGIFFVTLKNVSDENQQMDALTFQLLDAGGNPLSTTADRDGYRKITTYSTPYLDVVQPGEVTYLQDSFTFAIGDIDKFDRAVITDYAVKTPDGLFDAPLRLTVTDPGEAQFMSQIAKQPLSAFATVRNETAEDVHYPVLTVLCFDGQDRPFAFACGRQEVSLPQGGEITLYPNLFDCIANYSDIYATDLLETISRVEYAAYAGGRSTTLVYDQAEWIRE